MIPTEIDRLAAAVNALRPDWPTQSLRTFIAANLAERSYRDAALALAWVATDPQTRTPKRVLEGGPWWRATSSGTDAAPAERVDHGPRCYHCGYYETDHPELNRRVPGYCPDFAATKPDRKRADRPDQTRNLDRTPLPDRSTRRIK